MTELRDAVVFFNRGGRGVKLEGLGTYAPKIGLDGKFGVTHRLDSRIKNELNAPGALAKHPVGRWHDPQAGQYSFGFTAFRSGQVAKPPLTWSPCGTPSTPTIQSPDRAAIHHQPAIDSIAPGALTLRAVSRAGQLVLFFLKRPVFLAPDLYRL